MKSMTKKSSSRRRRKNGFNCIRLICWIIVPAEIIAMLVLDGIGLYRFNTERLLVMGVCILVMLIPFFNEITVKSISIKKEND